MCVDGTEVKVCSNECPSCLIHERQESLIAPSVIIQLEPLRSRSALDSVCNIQHESSLDGMFLLSFDLFVESLCSIVFFFSSVHTRNSAYRASFSPAPFELLFNPPAILTSFHPLTNHLSLYNFSCLSTLWALRCQGSRAVTRSISCRFALSQVSLCLTPALFHGSLCIFPQIFAPKF